MGLYLQFHNLKFCQILCGAVNFLIFNCRITTAHSHLVQNSLHVGPDPAYEEVDICKDREVAKAIIITKVISNYSNSIKVGDSIDNMKKW